MEILIGPKQQFLQLEAVAAEFRSVVTKSAVQTGITYALAEMNFNGKYNGEQMKAVREFAQVFLNLGERPPEPKKHPSKSLTYPDEANKNRSPKTEKI